VPVSAFIEEDDGPASQERTEIFSYLRAKGAVDLLRVFASIEDEQMRLEVLSIIRRVVRFGPGQDI